MDDTTDRMTATRQALEEAKEIYQRLSKQWSEYDAKQGPINEALARLAAALAEVEKEERGRAALTADKQRLDLIDANPPVRVKVWAKDADPLPKPGTTIVSSRNMARYRVLSADRKTREVVLVDEDAITAATEIARAARGGAR